MGRAEQVRVGRFASRAEAEVARAMLSEHGVEARLAVDDVAGLHPELSLATGGVHLEVDEPDADEARELLADVPDSTAATRTPLRAGRRVAAWMLLLVAVLLAVMVVIAIAEVGLHWL